MFESMPGRPLRADARRNRAKVMAAAERLLARDGDTFSMRELARRAGVGLATIYRQFPTKEVLYEAIVVDRVNRLLDRAHAAADSPRPGDALFGFITFAVTDSTGERALVDALVAAGGDPATSTAAMQRDLESATGVLLRRAQETGEVRRDIGLREAVTLITGLCLAADRQRWDPGLRTQVLGVVFDGMRGPRSAGR